MKSVLNTRVQSIFSICGIVCAEYICGLLKRAVCPYPLQKHALFKLLMSLLNFDEAFEKIHRPNLEI